VGVGDFCRFGDRMGTVEDIGLRSTRVRTLDRTLVTVSSSTSRFSGSRSNVETRPSMPALAARTGEAVWPATGCFPLERRNCVRVQPLPRRRDPRALCAWLRVGS
jgi:hypothetical protein